MDRVDVLKLALFMIFLVLIPKMKGMTPVSPISARPLCASQFLLVSHACASLPFHPFPPPSPPSPPPSPPPSNPSGHRHRHRHDHGHKHRHHRHKETPVEQNCCRWLKAVDTECICELLVHLPPFLSRPMHQYTVEVEDSCNVTYQCGSRIRV